MVTAWPGCRLPLTLSARGALYHSVRLESRIGHAILSGRSESCTSKVRMAIRRPFTSPASSSGPPSVLINGSAQGVFVIVSNTPWAEPLISTDGGPLLLAGEVKGRRIAILTFDVHDSDLPLNIAWPILLSNLTEWYKAPRALNVNGSLHPGQAVTIQPDLGATLVRVQRPDGAITSFNVDQPLLVDADTPLPGLYSVDVYQGS